MKPRDRLLVRTQRRPSKRATGQNRPLSEAIVGSGSSAVERVTAAQMVVAQAREKQRVARRIGWMKAAHRRLMSGWVLCEDCAGSGCFECKNRGRVPPPVRKT